jgi:hypothetical protein
MQLKVFIEERQDESVDWADLFEKYDCVFLAGEDDYPELYEQFKTELAEHLFDLRYSYKHLWEQVDEYYETVYEDDADGCASLLKSFLQFDDRPSYISQPNQFIEELKGYVEERGDQLDVEPSEYMCETEQLLDHLRQDIRGSFASSADGPREFSRMTSQIGEVLANLVFSQIRGCGLFIQAKVDLDNPDMPRHGEDLLAFFLGEAASGTDDQLFFVEVKSTKRSISQAVREVRDRFADHLNKFPGYEVARFKRVLERKLGSDEAKLPRERITKLVWRAKLEPDNNQLKFSPFLHCRDNYSPRKSTLAVLGEIDAEPCRIHVIMFQFTDFEDTVREIFERAWTI